MVLAHHFQDVFDASAKTTSLSLPLHKESVLNVEFEKLKNNKNNKPILNGSELPLPFAASEVFHTSIIDWRRLTAYDKECKTVYEISFDMKGSNFNYNPGDTIGVIPKNDKSEVDSLLNHLALMPVADLWYTLSIDNTKNSAKNKVPAHIPLSSTIRYVLTNCVDLRAIIKKLFLLALSRHTKDETERKVLEYLCSKEGSVAYTKHILNSNTSLLDLLATFRSCKPSIETLFQHLPRLLPRPYSIANSPLRNPNVLKICFSVINIGGNRKGLTTGWIESIIMNQEHSLENAIKNLSIAEDQTIPIYLRKNVNGFKMPEEMNTPLILIGPGTGISPFIGFLEQIECLKGGNENELCDIMLFFGCRHPKLDFIYEEQLKGFKARKVLSCLEIAFSRYENYATKYVQDAIMDNGEAIVKLIKDGSRIFVSGDVKTIDPQIKDAIVKCLVKYDNKSIEEAEIQVHDLQKDQLYIVDIWN